jgi:hypothetical protein
MGISKVPFRQGLSMPTSLERYGSGEGKWHQALVARCWPTGFVRPYRTRGEYRFNPRFDLKTILYRLARAAFSCSTRHEYVIRAVEHCG